MFRSKPSLRESGGQVVQDALGDRFQRLEASVEARFGQLGAADASLEERVRSLEAAVAKHQQGIQEFRQDVSSRVEEIAGSQEAEHSKSRELSENLRQVSAAVASLTEECSICASSSRVDGLQEELNELTRSFAEGSKASGQAAALSPQVHLQVFKDRLADQSTQLERLSSALCGNGDQLRVFMDEETLRQNNLRVEGATAEWLVRDVETWLNALPRGKFLESPPFVLEVPGVGCLDSLRLRFFPNGGSNVSSDGTCSLYLAHPSAMPWAQYELMVGRSRRGTFDPIFAGSDDFCPLGPELYPLDDVNVVRLCVRFLPLSAAPTPAIGESVVAGAGRSDPS